MKTSDFYYDLPKELIAQDPLEDRSSSRLLHLSMQDGSLNTDILQIFWTIFIKEIAWSSTIQKLYRLVYMAIRKKQVL